MMRLRAFLRARVGEGDEGIGMLLVIGVSGVVMSLVLVCGAIATRALNSAREHDTFGSALAAAESGLDQGIARVQLAYDVNGSSEIAGDCSAATALTQPAGTSAPTAVDAWAKSALATLGASSPCRHKVAGGEYVFLKPIGFQTVYARGWSPSYGAVGARIRTIKSDYIFAPYKPSNAVLTSGNLEIDSSTTITSATSASASQASVHSNGNITVPNGNPTVTGAVTQSGGGALPSSNKFTVGASRSATQSLPTINARSVYNRNVSSYLNAWYDLCPDGKARAGSTGGPCTGALIGDYGPTGALKGGTFRSGWTYNAATTPVTWTASGAFSDGVYYVSQANVSTSGGNKQVSKATIIASSVGTTCDKSGGNIDWNLIDIATPYISNLFMLADQDLRTASNFSAGSKSGSTVVSGLFVAGDQVQLETSSNGAYGAVIAGDQCDPSGSLVDANVIKNPSVYFDPTGYAPFTDVVNTTLWLELGR